MVEDKTRDDKKFVFSWNLGDTIEIHSEESFRRDYSTSWDNQVWDISHVSKFATMDELLEKLDVEESEVVDNMFVTRVR